MKDLLEISCGLDVHKEKIVACILTGPLGKPTHSEIREFSTLIPDMVSLREWIVSQNCHHVAMESTGIYWIPIYEILEDAFSGDITLLVVNARHMKNVPGKKTDMRDSEWISTLLRAGLLNGSFIPEKKIREFRDLNRYRKSIIRDITSQKNRIEKFLQSSGFRLSSFISDIFGASGRNIILHLIEHGQIDRTSLTSCLKTKTRNRTDEILMSVNGTLSGHQKSFLKILMDHYDSLKEHLNEIEEALQQDMEPFISQIEQLNSIYGISTTASCAIIAEIGIDMTQFKTAEHICSWAGLCPGNNESAGKRKSTSVTKGNPYVKSMLCEIAWVIAGKRNTYLSAWYWRIKQKKGSKKAIIALARKLLVIIYTMLKQGTLFDESCFEVRRKKCEQKQLSHYIKELEKHGYHVENQN
jgi:transposase